MHAKLPPYETATTYADAPTADAAVAAPRRRWVMPLIVVAVLAALAVGGWLLFAPKPAAKPVTPPPPTVTVLTPGATAVADSVSATGSIAARRDAPVGVQGDGGLVTAVLVEAGQFVRRGQVMARIDRAVATSQAAQMAAGIRSAKADAALAQSELDRAVKLVDKGFISKADIDRRTATRDGNVAKVGLAQAQYDEMQARLARLDIRAPAAGLVLARSVETGQVVGPGSAALFRIAEGGVLEMRALVAEQDMERLRVGQPANVRPAGSTTDYRGRVWLLDPVIDQASRQGVARVALPYSPGLRVGAFGSTTISVGETTRPVLPQSAVQVDEAGNYVYIVGPGDVVTRRAITVGTVSDAGVSVAKGLDGSERVVATAAAFLRPGEKITPVVTPRGAR